MKKIAFDDPDAFARLDAASDYELDDLAFGVIGFERNGQVVRYNAAESKWAGLSPTSVLGNHLFEAVAPCMNNFMVAQRFEDAAERREELDAMVDYVLTFRMRPKRVMLRLLAKPDAGLQYLLVKPSA